MLKFKGKPNELRKFIQGILNEYGAHITLKKVIESLGDKDNVCM